MMQEVKFTKMHGLGNDFVVIQKSELTHIHDLSHFVKQISNRRLGIGCDQVILYEERDRYYDMYIYNQDGSSAEACGNGTRCLTRLLGLPRVTINVKGRVLECTLDTDKQVTVNMGSVKFEATWIPEEFKLYDAVNIYQIEPIDIICVDVGNPHVVIFKQDLLPPDQALLGQALEKHRLFKNGVNVNFAVIEDGVINLRVWERGDGFTLACGSGACASFAAAYKRGFVEKDATVRFAHGNLAMSIKENEVLMTGPTEIVAKGAILHARTPSANQL